MQNGLKPNKHIVLIFPYFNFGCVCLDYAFSLTLVHKLPKTNAPKLYYHVKHPLYTAVYLIVFHTSIQAIGGDVFQMGKGFRLPVRNRNRHGLSPDLCGSNSAAILNLLSHLTHPALVFPVAVTRNSALISFTSILLTGPFLCN